MTFHELREEIRKLQATHVIIAANLIKTSVLNTCIFFVDMRLHDAFSEVHDVEKKKRWIV